MAKNIKDFANNVNDKSNNTFDKTNLTKEDEKEVKNVYEKYRGKSNDELKKELFNEFKKEKENGKIDESYLNNMKSKISPMLNEEQQKKLNEMIDMLKRN